MESKGQIDCMFALRHFFYFEPKKRRRPNLKKEDDLNQKQRQPNPKNEDDLIQKFKTTIAKKRRRPNRYGKFHTKEKGPSISSRARFLF